LADAATVVGNYRRYSRDVIEGRPPIIEAFASTSLEYHNRLARSSVRNAGGQDSHLPTVDVDHLKRRTGWLCHCDARSADDRRPQQTNEPKMARLEHRVFAS
jgi:hypothetical protein